MTSLDNNNKGETSMSKKITDNSQMTSSEGTNPKTAKEYDLLLLGKTGNGKSATGNSILGYKAFIASAKSTSVTKNIKRNSKTFNGLILNVVDAPGVMDTGASSELDKGSNAKKITEKLQKAVEKNPRGYNACILVTRYGNRFTEEESNAIHMLKQIFGEHFIKDFCILVMTNGDTFEAEENDFTFEQWIYEQSGSLSDVFHDCGFRVVLFDNLTKDPRKKEKQVDELIELVDRIAAKNLRYSNEYFQKALKSRTALLIQLGSDSVKERFISKTKNLLSEIEMIQHNELDEQLPLLTKMLETVQELINEIIKEDKGTDVFKEEKDTVWSLKVKLEMDITINKKISTERKNFEKEKARQDEIMRQQLKENEEKMQRMLQEKKEVERKLKERKKIEKENARRDEIMRQQIKENEEKVKRFQEQKEFERKLEERNKFERENARRDEIMRQQIKENEQKMQRMLQEKKEFERDLEERNKIERENARRDEIMRHQADEHEEKMKKFQQQREFERKLEEERNKFQDEKARQDEKMRQHSKETDEKMQRMFKEKEMERKLEEERNKNCNVQ